VKKLRNYRCDGLPRDAVLRSLDRQIDAWTMTFTCLRRGFGRQAPSPPPKSKSWKQGSDGGCAGESAL